MTVSRYPVLSAGFTTVSWLILSNSTFPSVGQGDAVLISKRTVSFRLRTTSPVSPLITSFKKLANVSPETGLLKATSIFHLGKLVLIQLQELFQQRQEPTYPKALRPI